MSNYEEFAVNGRFLTQVQTGVQRYALNVVRSLEQQLKEAGRTSRIIAPVGAMDPGLSNMPMIHSGSTSGHSWEQLVLPQKWKGRLLNLCNTAPAFKSDQIVCIHDANIFTYAASYSPWFRAFYRSLQPLIIQGSARIATVSHTAARQLCRYLPIALKDIVVLPNGHEHCLAWDPRRAVAAPAFVDKTNRPFVMALGSRAKHKNLELLLDAAPFLDELGIDIVIAGGDHAIFANGELEARENVRFTGRVTDDDLAYLLDHALCLAFPSLSEGFGLPIVEAMARGCPVVAANCSSLPEICGGAALLASPYNPMEWVSQISALGRSRDLRDDLVGRGKEQSARYSWSQTAEGYMDLLNNPRASARSRPAPKPALTQPAVVIATRGRPDVVTATVNHLISTQTLQPQSVIVSCVQQSDAGDLASNPAVKVLLGPPGLAAQRNTALAQLPKEAEIVVFFDDDFIADKDWLAVAARTFRDESTVVGLTGRIIADGINGPGISFEEGLQLVANDTGCNWTWIDRFSPYGCNMAFRRSAIGDARFDERLVLYGWLEDRDFGATVGKSGGRLIKTAEAAGVHMGVKSGRLRGDRLGYSQITNPIYMLRKGTISLKKVATHIGGNMASNFGKLLWPEPYIDRRGRARGNLIAIRDILCGRIIPENAEKL